jgi:hypothetical protein
MGMGMERVLCGYEEEEEEEDVRRGSVRARRHAEPIASTLMIEDREPGLESAFFALFIPIADLQVVLRCSERRTERYWVVGGGTEDMVQRAGCNGERNELR